MFFYISLIITAVWIIAFIAKLLIALRVQKWLSSPQRGPKVPRTKLPSRKTKYFFSAAERSFFEVLTLWNEKYGYYIFPKVRLADVFYLAKTTEHRQSFFNKIKFKIKFNKIRSKHVDFLICDTENITPILAIKLDDSSHTRRNRKERDQFMDMVFKDAELPLLRIPAKDSYSLQELSKKINALIIIFYDLSSKY
ncbi:MAG: DUF2726 domain-containing protein [Thermosipho sp. (in: Bacteria)]|nr:DUF2726 domain-containing protein [Thermosipho sp. (in: thermotogales)]